MPLRVALADDEPFPRERLARLLREAGCEVLATLEDGAAMLAWIREGHAVDALFLDIRMPGLTGLDLLAELDNALPVVLVTAHTEHTLAAFEHAALDYLLKPVSAERLGKTLARLRQHPENPGPRRPLMEPAAPNGAHRFPVRAGEGLVFLELRRVSHFELEGDWVWAWTQGERYRTSWARLTEVEAAFPEEPFCRIQRHLLLRPGTVAGLRSLWGSRSMVRVQGGQELEVSRAMTPRLKEMLGA